VLHALTLVASISQYKWPDGACYKGFFKGGHREGEGTYKFAGKRVGVIVG